MIASTLPSFMDTAFPTSQMRAGGVSKSTTLTMMQEIGCQQ
jgi:hypothetical protein